MIIFWIPFILLKTKNWKHYSKIIFKYVNNTVRPIFNENFVEKRGLWVLWTVHKTHWQTHKIFLVKEVVGPAHSAQDPLTDKIPCETRFSIFLKKKKENANTQTQHQKRNPNAYLVNKVSNEIYYFLKYKKLLLFPCSSLIVHFH